MSYFYTKEILISFGIKKKVLPFFLNFIQNCAHVQLKAMHGPALFSHYQLHNSVLWSIDQVSLV